MAQPPILPPNPSLVAILLVIKSLSGPRLVFHYPPNPACGTSALANNPQWYGTNASTMTDDETTSSASSTGCSSSSSEDDDDDEEDDKISRAGSRATSRATSRGTAFREGSRRGRAMRSTGDVEDEDTEDASPLGDDDGRTGSGLGHAPGAGKKGSAVDRDQDGEIEWERLLGFKTESLEKMLCPGRAFHKKKFEVGLEGLAFLGCPMFVREDGAWRKRKKRWKTSSGNSQNDKRLDNGNESDREDDDQPDADADKGNDMTASQITYRAEPLPPGFEAGYGHGLMSGAASDAGSDTKSASTNGTDNEMTMFNAVFVLNPPALEYQLRVREMYDNVVRTFAKDLKHEQAKSSYVWKQSKAILSTKNKARENRDPVSGLWHNLISLSPLAKSIAIMFDSISNSKIAHVYLNAQTDASYQIPQAPSTPYIPKPTEPQMPGLWLTTANLPDEWDADASRHVSLSPHSALLLLEDKETLLKEIEADAKAHSATLAFYIHNLTPTKSLQKLATTHKIPVADLEFLATHLIYWRRARAVPPLHQRDTYIVSPNADMRKLSSAIPAYASRFPTLPSLPKMLSLLSNQQPRPYGSLIPSKDHRPAYMEILAWLMRGGWVTQLRTFAWIRVSPQVQADVAGIMEKEAKDAAKAAIQHARERRAAHGDLSDDASDRATIASDDAPSTPHRRSPRTSGSSGASGALDASVSDAGSTRSDRTVFNTSPTAHRSSPLPGAQSASINSIFGSPAVHGKRPGSASEFQAAPASKNPADYAPAMIYSPQKANSLQARWIEHIWSTLEDKEARELWPVLQKYFDGLHALDDISGREGIKRKRIAGVLTVLKEREVLYTMRHW
ncbi:hypothetical protein K490DRAFT_72584 [Saccharata proteae CBS 121410]|uniref:Nitrogen permease regulator 3 n=1 Tax=Saccharata proteae CBS 121410 TaxID=1314787 RepID=A0A6A5YAM4_9PEZI|nr:hypothetical protein K490DRAFT_72584 [Saccharata proteae CBS 121410]